MLYKQNNTDKLSDDLFKNPTSEYRGAPFFSWNCKLRKKELLWQIDRLKQMGFGGFHMHSRAGMATKYLSGEFMDLIKSCTEKAKAANMLAWLYDEDRWPSGTAGGMVTKDRRNSAKHICFTKNKIETVEKEEGIKTGKPYLLAKYRIELTAEGYLKDYKIVNNGDRSGKIWYAYVKTAAPRGWYNGQTYVDTLSKAAMDKFIDITYETYKKSVGEYFGDNIHAIFTDEPQFEFKNTLAFASDESDVILPWTTDFDVFFKAECGLDLISHLPELVWDLPQKPSEIRYQYHNLVCEAFTRAFSDNCGRWCRENGINLTGHMVEEQSLYSQTRAIGEAMRAYRSFGIPGIDMLCNNVELTTAKQAQSVCHQYKKEAMVSELYGVTNWDFDFRGHKFQGDWQAALGVTVRVPHLSWVSMKGSAKRDYPASIHYQSPWYKEYSYIENHFARVNTALTRGTPIVRVGVIHPIESYWLNFGPSENTAQKRAQLEENFTNVTEWLLFGMIDFDFIAESLLPDLYVQTENKTLCAGAMNYSAIIVPAPETIRGSTLKILNEFQKRGGKIIFMGDCPQYADAKENADIYKLYDKCEKIDYNKTALLNALESERDIMIQNSDASMSDNLIYRLCSDNDARWLFVAHAKKTEENDNCNPQEIIITVKGEYEPTQYETLTGEKKPIEFVIKDGMTKISYTLYRHDSLLIKLDNAEKMSYHCQPSCGELLKVYCIKDEIEYEREEDNVYVLDMARYSVNDKYFSEEEELLRIDLAIRQNLNYPLANGEDIQPWAIKEEKTENFVWLKFNVSSKIEAECMLAYEEAEEVYVNGKKAEIVKDGYFVDHSIFTMPLPKLKKGDNEILIKAPISKRISLENYFLLGDFNVCVRGSRKVITDKETKISFGTITDKGMPFYGGNITYKVKKYLPESNLKIRVNYYRGALIGVKIDGKDAGKIVFDPYSIDAGRIDEGEHTFEFTLFGNRYNTFGPLHKVGTKLKWFGPKMWYTKDDMWSYDYMLHDTGILAAPVFECYRVEK